MKRIALGILVALALVYGGGAYYFSQHTFPNTSFNGEDRSYESVSELHSYRDAEKPVQITGRGGKELSIPAEDISLKKKPAGTPELAQNAVAWPVAFFNTYPYQVEYTYEYNEEQLGQVLSESVFMQEQTDPVNASLQQEEDGYVIVPEEVGTKIEPEKLQQAVAEELDQGNTVITLPDTAYVQPAITQEDTALQEEQVFFNSLYETKIVYDFEDREYVFTGQTLIDLYDKTADGYEINYDRTRAMLADMATETDTFGQDREFTTYYGNTITIPGGPSVYGWLMDVDSTTDEFIGWVEERHSEVTTPFYFHKAMNRETDEIGDTYIEIDLDDQWMYVYLEGELIDEGPTVSGQPSFGTPTPVAVNFIIDKMKDRVLRGIEPESGEEYETPVDYWFSINWSDVGIHNSTWRTEFGGDIYQWLGSYGCINVPDHLARTIYDYIPIGTPVISY